MEPSPAELQRGLAAFVRAFGLHQPDRTACGQPISTSEAHALGVISEHHGIRVTALARELVLEKSTVSRLVRSMSERGWVEIVPGPTDARVRLIHLTAAGARAAERLARARAAHFASVLENIESGKRKDVIAALAELTRAAHESRDGKTDVATA